MPVKKKPSANTTPKKKKPAACSDDDSDQAPAPATSPTVEAKLRAMHPEVPGSPGKTTPAIEDRKDVLTYLSVFDAVPAKASPVKAMYIVARIDLNSPAKAVFDDVSPILSGWRCLPCSPGSLEELARPPAAKPDARGAGLEEPAETNITAETTPS